MHAKSVWQYFLTKGRKPSYEGHGDTFFVHSWRHSPDFLAQRDRDLYLSGCRSSKGAGVAIVADDGRYFILWSLLRFTLCITAVDNVQTFCHRETGISLRTYTKQKEQLVQRNVRHFTVAAEVIRGDY